MKNYFKNDLPIMACLSCYNNLGNGEKRDKYLCGDHCIGIYNDIFKGEKIKRNGITYITINPYRKYKNFKPNEVLYKQIEKKEFIKEEDFKV